MGIFEHSGEKYVPTHGNHIVSLQKIKMQDSEVKNKSE